MSATNTQMCLHLAFIHFKCVIVFVIVLIQTVAIAGQQSTSHHSLHTKYTSQKITQKVTLAVCNEIFQH